MLTDETESNGCQCESCETAPDTAEPSKDGTEVKIYNMGVFSPSDGLDRNQDGMFKEFRLDITNNAKRIITESNYIPPVAFFMMDNNEVKLMELHDYMTDTGFDLAFNLIQHFVDTKKNPAIHGIIIVTGALVAIDRDITNRDPSNIKEVVLINSQDKSGVKMFELAVIRTDEHATIDGQETEVPVDEHVTHFFKNHES